uniref:Uncharacterized protein n=1 Tax=Anopheles culicifacies TaxID=139723 RepID=A0A182M9W4_9DIPT
MVQDKKQMSIRIVSVDHYMSKPDPQFDACYSEFRGSEIKQVPVIRLFGSTSEGTHSCVHIHGVFPYFYIPFDGSVADKLLVDQKIYQLACALDKGINVSLGRSASQTKHIFKIVLVKGIPIYGYHRSSHYYFKIYMYNPFMLRNATQLLMNGTILSGTYQVHETHIPYILQFFIDYNLYGMSFLELNTNGLRQRTNIADIAGNIPPKMSTSEYEIDVLASDILNREPEENDTGEFANPGIASIWKDEQTRRLLLGLEQPERMNLSQDDGSGHEVITESDRFYRARLLSKLSKEHTASSSAEEQRKVPTTAYPSEAVEGEIMLDASCIVDHIRPSGGQSNESLYDSQISYHFDASTVVDEEKIISMSQNPDMTLGEEDYNLLEIMRELEAQAGNNMEEDCLLAPLTQSTAEHNRSIMQRSLNLSQVNKKLNASMYADLETVGPMSDHSEQHNPADGSFDSDDEFLLDFSQKQSYAANKELAEASTLFNDSDDDLLSGGVIPQLDGGDDSFGPISSKRGRPSKAKQTPNNLSAKKMRIDLTQPLSRKSLTPRKVTFAASPEEQVNERTKRVLKEFEESSPNTLKNLEIRIPKLGLIKKSILFTNRKHGSPKSSTAVNKLFFSSIPKLDPSAYDVNQSTKFTAPDSSAKNVSKSSSLPQLEDRYHLSRTYDIVHNFDPLEGPSTPKSERVRRKIETPDGKGQPKPKLMKLEEEQQIELILSQRFKNIVRLSPKVLIKPLLLNEKLAVNSELSLDAYSSSHNILPKDGLKISAQSDVAVSSESPHPSTFTSSSELNAASTKTADTVCTSGGRTTTPQKEGTVVDEIASNHAVTPHTAEEPTAESEGMDVEFSLPSNSDSNDTDEPTPNKDKREVHKESEKINDDDDRVISIEDNDNGDAQIPTSSSSEKVCTDQAVISLEDDSGDDVEMITPSLLDALPLEELFPKNDEALSATIDLLDDKNEKRTGPDVTIGNQLDGVMELMDDSPNESQQREPESGSAEEETGEEDANIQSFCEKTLLCELDDINSDSDDSCLEVSSKGDMEKDDQVIISLATAAPTREDAQRAIDKLEIPAVVNTTPFYSDPADVTGRKEVGHTVLNIAGNSLNDEQEFTSTIAGLGSLKHLRYDNLHRTFGENINDVLGPIGPTGPSSERMNELLASEGCVAITPSEDPPNRTEALNWVDNRCRQRQVDPVASIDLDSPIKVKPADTIMALDDEAQPERLTPRIASVSSLHLSVLIAKDGHTDLTNGKSPKKTVSSTTMTTRPSDHDTSSSNVPTSSNGAKTPTTELNESSPMEEGVDEIASTQEEQVKRQSRNTPIEAGNLTQQPPCSGTSDQSDLIEQSNADISTATPLGFKVNCENLQDAKSKCEVS